MNNPVFPKHFPPKWLPLRRRKCDNYRKPKRVSDSKKQKCALAGALVLAVFSLSPRLLAEPAAEPIPATEGDTAPGDRADHVLRALHPQHPTNVDGLHLTASGTGFFVTPQTVLTNFHVAGHCKALTIGNNTEGHELPASVFATDPEKDLAILGADDPTAKPARFQTALDRETGEGLVIVGYPEHGLPVLEAELQEAIASPVDLTSDRPYFPFGGAVRHGNSGGPVLDSNGAVLGIVQAKIDTVAMYRATGEVVDRLGFAIANSVILEFLAANHVPVQSAEPGESFPPEELLKKAHEFVRPVGCWN